MEQKNGKVTLRAKVIAGIIILAVVVFNLVVLFETDNGSYSLGTLKAYAQTGGTNNEEESASDGCNPMVENCTGKITTVSGCFKSYTKTTYFNAFNQAIGATLYIDGNFISSWGTGTGAWSTQQVNGTLTGSSSYISCPAGTTSRNCRTHTTDCVVDATSV